MRASQWERSLGVIEGRACPIDSAMADRAGEREARLQMVGVRRGVVER